MVNVETFYMDYYIDFGGAPFFSRRPRRILYKIEKHWIR